MAILNSVKMREEGKYSKAAPPVAGGPPTSRPGQPPAVPRQPLPGYNRLAYYLLLFCCYTFYHPRYDQDKYQQADTEGFKIDTTGTYAGKTLKSVMDQGQGAKARAPAMPPPSSVARPLAQQQNQQQQQKGSKRVSKTPIIIIPAAPKSLITMFNAKDLLQDLKFISTEDKRGAGAKRENDVLIQRRKEGGLTVPYRVLDNPTRPQCRHW